MKMTLPAHQRRQITLAAIPDGVDGIKATLALMVNIARRAKTDYTLRDRVLSLVSDVRQKDWINEVRAVHQFVRDDIRYVKDINGIETLATPAQTLQIGQGDCDDKALLTAAMLESIGHPVRFVAVGREPGQFEHVLVETKLYTKGGTPHWIPVETTEPVPVGWYPPGMVYRLVYNVSK